MIAFIGMETSGVSRRALQALGHTAISCDTLYAKDGATEPRYAGDSGHYRCDVFDTLEWLWQRQRWPDVALFHPDCTYLTNSAEWAYAEPDFDRYPGVGYHQKLKPNTLTGAARRKAREAAVQQVMRIRALKIRRIVIENPIGHLSGQIGRPTQVVQPYQFGDDASKATCLWVYEDGELLPPQVWIAPTAHVPPTLRGNGKRYWANQTDTGQNRLSPGAERWAKRADTYPGIAAAIAAKLVDPVPYRGRLI